MRVVMFCHSLISDWNHGNAHFLRGIADELVNRGHQVDAYEPEDAWSVYNLAREQGLPAISSFQQSYFHLKSHRYRLESLDLDCVLDLADLVIVHEWNDPELIRQVGDCRRRNPHFRLFFHDTHHRAVTAPHEIDALDLRNYDGALVFGASLADIYYRKSWAQQVWVWHEAADVRRFRPSRGQTMEWDLVWVGNWGDDERTDQIREFLLTPVSRLRLKAAAFGVRYPEAATQALANAGVFYGGWVSNLKVAQLFNESVLTVHIPRQVYATILAGIPTIRVFEALASGIPLVASPWRDVEHLFGAEDYLVCKSGADMEQTLRDLLNDEARRAALKKNGLNTILSRHTCMHRVDELLAILADTTSSSDSKR